MIKVHGITDVGLVRKNNQDAYAVKNQTASGHTLCVVCDGMGGAAGGQLASRIAVSTFMEEMEKLLVQSMSPEQLRDASACAVSLANQGIRAAAGESPEYNGMGTTLVSAVSYGDGAVITNVGDSRAYHITPGGITRVTRDHSLVQRMVERGDITAEEARRHPNRNVITRALGPDIDAECDGYICPMAAGDYLLLCTDGLVNTVNDQEMLFEVLHSGSLEQALERLFQIARDRGAPDNVTAVLLQIL